MLATSISLLERARDGADQASRQRLVDLYTPLLRCWLQRRGVPDSDAEDLLQEVFAVLVRKLPEFHYDPGRGSFRAWLGTILAIRPKIDGRFLNVCHIPAPAVGNRTEGSMPEMSADSDETAALLERIRGGDKSALSRLLACWRPGLVKFVSLRLGGKLRTRIDPSDIVQEAQLEVVRRIDDFLRRRPMPFHVWLRKTAYERLLNLRRDHHRARRSLEREEPLPARSSLLLARPLLSGPSKALLARERAERIGRAVAELVEADREILLMRHGEGLPYEEIAWLLEIEPAAARKRYGRALIRLQRVLSDHGLLESAL